MHSIGPAEKMGLIPTLTLNIVIRKVGWRKTVLSRCWICSYHTTSPMWWRNLKMSWRSSLPRLARCLYCQSPLSRYWRSIISCLEGDVAAQHTSLEDQHSKGDALESQQTPAVPSITHASPGSIWDQCCSL